MGNLRWSSSAVRALIVLAFTCWFLLIPSLSAFAQSDEDSAYFDIILEVKRDRKVLSNAVFGLEKEGKYYVPLQELARLIKFEVNVSLEAGTASGFFVSPENAFTININQSSFSIGNKTETFDKTEAFVFKQKFGVGDLYLTPNLLNRILPLDLELDPLFQVLDIRSKRKLPYELFVDRKIKRGRLLDRLENKKEESYSDLIKIENQYKLFTLPAIDVTSTTQVSEAESGLSESLNIRGRNDLLYAEADYNFGFDKRPDDSVKFNNARFMLERKAFEKGDLPANLQLVQVGDIRPKPSRLIDGTLVGRGVLISTESQKQNRNFDQITVEGTAEPGWEVELYRNSELIGFQLVDQNGEYRFEDVTLNYSSTTIRTILYGPEGQIEESEEVYSISDSMLKPGKNVIEASFLDLNNDLILTDSNSGNRPEGFTHNFKFKRGINKWISGFTTFTHTPTKENNRNYGTIGLNFAFKGISALTEFYKDFSGGTAYDLRAATKFKDININLRTALYNGFESQEARFDEAAKTSETNFSVSRPVKTFLGNLGLRFRVDHETYKENPDQTNFDISQTFSKSGLRVTHGNQLSYTDNERRNVDGRINATYRLNRNWMLRGLLNYDLHPESEINNFVSELRYKTGKKFTAALNAERNFQNRSNKIGGEVSYDFEKIRTGLNVEWDSEQGFRSFLRAAFSLAPYGPDNDYIFSSQSLSNRAAVRGNVFLDKNNNDVFDDDDIPLEDAKINIGRRETNPSDASGMADYFGSPRNEYEAITLDVDTLSDPYYVPTLPGYEAVLRPSQVHYLDFPVKETGVVDGVVETDEGALAGVRMQLLQDGEVVKTTTTAFDGYYIFEYLEPGLYIIQIDPSYEQINVPPREISVTSENLLLYGIDFLILEQADEVACAEMVLSDGKITQDCPHRSAHDGMLQPASFNSDAGPSVNKVRMAQRDNSLRIVFDFDQMPNPYNVIEDEGKRVTIILKDTTWDMSETWENMVPNFIAGYSVENLSNGDAKIVIEPIDSIKVKATEILEPNEKFGHRLYFDFIK